MLAATAGASLRDEYRTVYKEVADKEAGPYEGLPGRHFLRDGYDRDGKVRPPTRAELRASIVIMRRMLAPPAPEPVIAPTPAPVPESVAPAPTSGAPLDAIRACESSGNYQAVDPSGTYRGAYQFDQQTWESVGGSGDPAAASPAEQDQRAAQLYAQRGRSPWPNC